MSTQKLATNALHAGHDVKTNGGSRAVPIYQTTSYVFNDADHAANLFSLKEYKNLFVIHEPFPVLTNDGWWKKQNYELTIPDILLGLKYGLLKKEEIPKSQELHSEKLKNVIGNFQDIIDYYYYKLGFRKSINNSAKD